MASFFYCGELSSAQLPAEQTAFRRDIKDNGYKSVFTNLWLDKGLGKNAQKSELRSVFPRIPRNTCLYTWLPAKLSKNRMRVKTSADWRLKIKLWV